MTCCPPASWRKGQIQCWTPRFITLARYAVAYRYPSDEPEPERAEFDRALSDVEALHSLILRAMPRSMHP